MTDSNFTALRKEGIFSGSTLGSGSRPSATGNHSGKGGNGEREFDTKKALRRPGACDFCKQRKLKCDSVQMPDNRCSNCIYFEHDCTHKEVAKTLGSTKGYVESLEARLEGMNQLINKLSPGIDVNQELECLEAGDPEESLECIPRNDEDVNPNAQEHLFCKLGIERTENRFFGKSSTFQLLLTGIDLKRQYHNVPYQNITKSMVNGLRNEMWGIPPWAPPDDDPPRYIYPPADLIPSLMEGYFANLNQLYPLLHRPTFEKAVKSKLHLSDHQFGAVLLLVCAHGSKFVDDPRVLADGHRSMRSAGWKWFGQVLPFRQSMFRSARLHELQVHALHVLFSQSNEMPEGSWAHIGIAIRLALELGAHRKKNVPPSPESELWKRAFWVICALDRQISVFAGRPYGLQDDDFDIEPCLECDDDYWAKDFQQPFGRPSSIAFFNSYLRLIGIMSNAVRLLYSVKQPVYKNTPVSNQQIVSDLHSKLSKWMGSMPNHLRLHQTFDSDLFAKQSAALHATYYHVQILIHRPLIATTRNPHPTVFPSLAICTNAAHLCCHTLDSFTRVSVFPHAQLEISLFTAAVILLFNVWSGKRAGQPSPQREMEDIQRCIGILQAAEDRYSSAGRVRDILVEMLGPNNWEAEDVESHLKKETLDDFHSIPSQAANSPTLDPAAADKASHGASGSFNGNQQTSHFQCETELGGLPVLNTDVGGPIGLTPAVSADTSASNLPLGAPWTDNDFDQFIFENFPSDFTIPPISPNADTYAIDALFGGANGVPAGGLTEMLASTVGGGDMFPYDVQNGSKDG